MAAKLAGNRRTIGFHPPRIDNHCTSDHRIRGLVTLFYNVPLELTGGISGDNLRSHLSKQGLTKYRRGEDLLLLNAKRFGRCCSEHYHGNQMAGRRNLGGREILPEREHLDVQRRSLDGLLLLRQACVRGMNLNARPLLHQRSPVGAGPSSNR